MSKKSEQEAAAEWVAIDSIHEWPKNPRVNDGKPVEKVIESIRRFGFGAPILARKANGEVIAGHTRLKAAKALGLDSVPVRYLDLSEDEAHVLALADNRLGEEAIWDFDVLNELLASMGKEDKIATGFDEREIGQILKQIVDGEGAKEIHVDMFVHEHTCPKCGFGFT
jgi:ParB/RepB/Spo0J family partition protein